MAKKKATLSEELKQLRTSMQEGKVIIGNDRVLKFIRSGKTKEVFIASNCPEKTLFDLEHLCNISGCTIKKLDFDNEGLGVFCKKNFFVSVLCIEA